MGKKTKTPAAASSDSEQEAPEVQSTKDSKRKRDEKVVAQKDQKDNKKDKKNKKKAQKEESSDSEEEKAAKSDDEESAEKSADSDNEEKEEKASSDEEAPVNTKKPKTESNGDQGDYEVFMSGLPDGVTEDDIKELLEVEVVSVKFMNDKFTGQPNGKAFVKLSDAESLETAVTHDGEKINDSVVKIEKPRRLGGDGGRSEEHTLFIGGVSDDVTDDDVHSLFSDCGKIVQIRWGIKEGQFKGYGHIQFEDKDSLNKAIGLNGTELKGREIRLDAASSGGGGRGGRGGRGGGGFGGRGGGGFGGRGGGGGGFGGRGGGGFGGRGGGRGGGFGGRGGGGDRGGRGRGGGRGGGRGRGGFGGY